MLSDSYLRKSTADAGKSVDRQERDWIADCLAQGHDQGRAFVDPDLSASRYGKKSRPDYAALVEHIRSGNCELLSMWESSRGSRQMAEWVGLLDLCRQHGVLIRIYGGDAQTFDPRRQRDREHLLNDGIAAERESETISARSRTGGRDLAYSGKPPGPLLYGYTRHYDERGKFASQDIHPERAARIRHLAAETLRGKSLNGLAMALNDAGVPSPKPGKSGEVGRWSGHGIARLLQKPGYVGRRTYHGEVVADAVWPPILTVAQHRQLCAMLRTPGRRVHNDSSLTHMNSGAARCGVCADPLRTNARTRYVCVRRGCGAVSVHIATLDAAVTEIILTRLRESDSAEAFAPRKDGFALDAALAELREVQDHLAEFVELAKARKLSAASLAAVEQTDLPLIAAAERKVARLSVPDALADYADVDVPAVWDTLTPAIRREFVMALADVVLSPVGKGGRWSWARLAQSRWVGDDRTWGEIWNQDE